MRSRFENGLKYLGVGFGALLFLTSLSQAQTAPGEQLQLELRQLRAEVDFLRDQLETGGGVADVRFEDLQRRIDRVLEDAAALATQASTAQKRADTAVEQVEGLEQRITVLESNIDTLATRFARLEEDLIFADPASASDGTSESPATEATATEEAAAGFVDDDGVTVPFPKDRTKIAVPSREISRQVTLDGADAAAVPEPLDASADLIPLADASPLEGDLPVFPGARPEAPARSISPSLLEDSAQATRDAEPVEPLIAPGTTAATAPAASNFAEAKRYFDAGNLNQAAASLQVLVDDGLLGLDAPEGHYLLGTVYLNQNRYSDAIQMLAQGLRQYPASDFGGPSLVNLSDALRSNGQAAESCRLLQFVELEYPSAGQAIADAQQRIIQYSC